MGVSRREVLRGGTLGALAVTVPWLVGAEELPLSARALEGTGSLTRADFAGCLGTRFRFGRPGQATVTAKLTAVRDRRERVGQGECFALRFRVRAARARLAQDTYAVQHGALGAFALFIVPMGANDRRAYYEAVINRTHA